MIDADRYYSPQQYQRAWKLSREIAQEVEASMLAMAIVTVITAMKMLTLLPMIVDQPKDRWWI